MGLILESTKVFNELRNGSDFLTVPGEFTTTIKANVGERIKVVTKFRIFWDAIVTPASTDTFVVAVVDGGHSITSTQGQNFENLGFRVDDVFDFIDNLGPTTYSGGIITLISGSYIEFTNTGAIPSAPTTFTDARIVGTNLLNNLQYSFNLPASSDSGNLINEVFNVIMSYEYSSMVESGPFITGVYKASLFSQSGSSQARQLPTVNTYEQVFEIETILTVPFYQEGQINNVEQALKPAPFNVETQFYAEGITLGVGGDAATNREFDLSRLANDSVGYFNQNFDGGARDYSIISVAYEELTSGDARDVPEITEVTKVTVIMAANNVVFLEFDPIVLGFSYLPTQSAYRSGDENFNDTWNFESLRGNIAGVITNATILTNFSVLLDNPNQIAFIFHVTLTQAQQDIMVSGEKLMLTIDNEDSALAVEDSNRLNLIIDVTPFTKNTDIPGLFNVVKDEVYYHTNTFVADVSTGFTNLEAWNQDFVMRDIHFELVTDTTLVEVNRLCAQIIAYNPTTREYFIIQKVEIPFNTDNVSSISGKLVQQTDFDGERGFLFPASSQFNFLKVQTSTFVDPDQLFKMQIGIFVDWQFWLENVFVDPVFYDPTKPNDNKNHKSSNYSLLNGYEIRLSLLSEVEKNDITTIYHNIQPTGIAIDFEKDKNTTPKYIGTNVYRDENDIVLPKKFVKDENTKIIATHTDGTVKTTIAAFECVIMLERKEQGTERSVHIISSLFGVLLGDILQPLSGETLLKKSIVGDNFTYECLVDGTQLDTKNWSVTSHIWEVPFIPTICFDVLGSVSFDPQIGAASGSVTWDFGDGSPKVTSLGPVHVYADTDLYTVCVEFTNVTSVSTINIGDDFVVGKIDLSILTDLNSFRFENDPLLTEIVLPESIQGFSTTDTFMFGTGIEELDLRPMSAIGGDILLRNTASLKRIITGSSTTLITIWFSHTCSLELILDMSGYPNINRFRTESNPLLPGIINPVTSHVWTEYFASDCPNVGYVDFTKFSSALDAIVITLNNNLYSAAIVNRILVDLDANTGINGSLTIDGTNAAPDGTSGGYDGTTAKANLIANGWTVTTN